MSQGGSGGDAPGGAGEGGLMGGNGTGDEGGPARGNTPDPSGCGCRTPGSRPARDASALIAMAGAWLVIRRRRFADSDRNGGLYVEQ
jgi:hypothetical protein